MKPERFFILNCDGESEYVYDYHHTKNGSDDIYVMDVIKDGVYLYTDFIDEDDFYCAMCDYVYNETEKAGAC